MPQEYVVTSDISLASVIRNELKKNGISPKYTGVSDFGKFSLEELQSVKRLNLEFNTFTDISILEHCPNLIELKIVSLNSKQASTNLSSEAYYSYISKRNNIKDFSVISKLKSLEFLTIQDSDFLQDLDLSNLPNLSGVYLIGNHQLKSVRGLDSLSELTELELVNNNALTPSFDFKKMIDQGLSGIRLDFDLYPALKKAFPDIATYISEKERTAYINCKWCENLSDIRTNDINTNRIDTMEQKAQEILNRIIGPNYSDIEKISAIYAYIIHNVKYDYQSLNAAKKGEENEALKQARENLSELTSKILDRKQSSYNAILEGKSVCEGYTNMMHYLLKSVGINSMTVHCSSDLQRSVIGRDSDHSVIKVEFNGEWYYFDPTWDANKNNLSNFFKTKEEFSSNHTLSMTERDVNSPSVKPYSNQEMTTILRKVVLERELGTNIIGNTAHSISSGRESLSPKELLAITNKKLGYLQSEYDKVAKEIEDLMTQTINKTSTQFADKMEFLQQKRDKISAYMRQPLNLKHNLEEKISLQNQAHQSMLIAQVEKLLNIRITPSSMYEYDERLKAPRMILKDQSQLSVEQGEILKKLDELYYDGELDLKSKQEIVMAVINQYNKMKKNAPKPAPRDNSTYTQKQEQNPSPMPNTDFNVDRVEETYRENFGYDMMTEEEKRAFDERLRQQRENERRKHQQKEQEKTEREKLEGERRELRRKQFAERKKAMGIDQDEVIDFDDLIKQQEIIEKMNAEKQENVENFGMHM